MVQVNGLGGTAATPTSQAQKNGGDGSTVDYNQFLQLLIAQMKNQDPTNPTDSTQFVSQLASFSSVEQQTQTNAHLSSLLTASALSEANAAVGRTVTSADGRTSGQVASVQVLSSGAEATLTTGRTVTLGAGITIS